MIESSAYFPDFDFYFYFYFTDKKKREKKESTSSSKTKSKKKEKIIGKVGFCVEILVHNALIMSFHTQTLLSIYLHGSHDKSTLL